MKKKIILSLLTLMISASLFIGCKDDTKETKTNLPTEPTAEEQVLLDLCDLYIKCNDFESANALVENHYGENTFFKKSKRDFISLTNKSAILAFSSESFKLSK